MTSTVITGIGKRLITVRTDFGHSRNKVALMFGICHRTYKRYELEESPLPLEVAAKFCVEYQKDLNWLIKGTTTLDSDQSAQLAGSTAKAVFENIEASNRSYTGEDVRKFSKYIFEQAMSKGTPAAIEAEQFFSAIV